jgi:hypothetical protein
MRTSLIVLMLAGSCATSKTNAERTGAPPRVPDTVEERVAAQRENDPKIDHTAEEARWGHEESVARKPENAGQSQAQGPGGQGADVKKAAQPKKTTQSPTTTPATKPAPP